MFSCLTSSSIHEYNKLDYTVNLYKDIFSSSKTKDVIFPAILPIKNILEWFIIALQTHLVCLFTLTKLSRSFIGIKILYYAFINSYLCFSATGSKALVNV